MIPVCINRKRQRWGPSSPSPKGHTPNFRPMYVVVKRLGLYMDQDATWYGGRPRPRPHCVRWGPSSPQRGTAPIFGPYLLWSTARPSQLLLITCWHIAYKSLAVAETGDRLATIDMGRKVRALLCRFPLGDGSQSNTMSPGPRTTSVHSGILIHAAAWPHLCVWPGPRPISVPSGILIYPVVWPQYTNVTERQTDRQWSDII